MQNIKTAEELKAAIQQLEDRQAAQWYLLKKEIYAIGENLNPINIIKNTFKEAVSTPDFKSDVVTTVIGLTTGFITKKVLLGSTHNPITKLLGVVIEMFVANKVTKNADGIKSIGSILLNKIVNQYRNSEKV